MNRVKGARRGIVAGLLVVLSAAAIAACGGSSSSTRTAASASAGGGGTSTTAGGGQSTALRECLKEHGVTLGAGRGFGGTGRPGTGTAPAGGGPAGGGMPSGTGTGSTGTPPTGTGTPPSGGTPTGGFAGGSSTFRTAIEACDKKLGIKAGAGFGARRGGGRFSSATLATFESCMKDHGVTLTRSSSGGGIFSRSAESDPKFKAAFNACRSDLGFAGPGQTGTGTGTTTT